MKKTNARWSYELQFATLLLISLIVHYANAMDGKKLWQREYEEVVPIQQTDSPKNRPWVLASDKNLRMSLCRRIFPSRKIVSSRHIRNAKVFVRKQHFHKVDVILCIDEYQNALYLAEGDACDVFKLKWSERGEYDLDSGKIPHRVKSSRILEKQKSAVGEDETKSDTNWKKRPMTMSNDEISPRKKRKYESLKGIYEQENRQD